MTSTISRYLLFYIALLSSGFFILRYLVRRDYLKRGRLSPIIAFLQAILFFMYGGFPYLYLDEDWPAVSVPFLIQIIGGLLVLIGLLAFL